MRVIILAAGQGFQLDGLNKCLLRDPRDGRTILDKMLHAFDGCEVTVVVGYQAVQIMNHYPRLDYVYNKDWAISNNSYSLALALDDTPCYVLSSDLIFEPQLVSTLEAYSPNTALTERRDQRVKTAINAVIDSENKITKTYQGVLENQSDPELIGVIKITCPKLLELWKKNCLQYPNLFVAQNLPLDLPGSPILSCDKQEHRFIEINTPFDYINLINETKFSNHQLTNAK